MRADWWARAIALAGVLVALLSLAWQVVTWVRRGRRIKLEARIDPHSKHSNQFPPLGDRLIFRLRNLNSEPIEILTIKLTYWQPHWGMRRVRWRTYGRALFVLPWRYRFEYVLYDSAEYRPMKLLQQQSYPIDIFGRTVCEVRFDKKPELGEVKKAWQWEIHVHLWKRHDNYVFLIETETAWCGLRLTTGHNYKLRKARWPFSDHWLKE